MNIKDEEIVLHVWLGLSEIKKMNQNKRIVERDKL